jgi:DNA-binding NtrC family response regulator
MVSMRTEVIARTGQDPFLQHFMTGDTRVMRDLRERIATLNAEGNADLVKFILIVGPSGSGKNHVARVIAGHRRYLQVLKDITIADLNHEMRTCRAPLEKYAECLADVLVPAIPGDLIESTLFGHVKGAFTGAVAARRGVLDDDGYSDVLLDEIADAPGFIQAKLLSLLDGRPFTPVGGTSRQVKQLKRRVLLATNRDLAQLVREGKFRQDLFYRITGHVVEVPALRDYIENVPAIAAAIIARLCPAALLRDRNGELPGLTAADIDWAMKQEWDGNIRELEDVLEFWLFDGARESLERSATRRRHRWRTDGLPADPGLTSVVATRLLEVVEGKRPAPGTFGAFMKDLMMEAREAVSEWYSRDPATARALFPDMKADSLKSSMSRARRR